MLTVTLKPTVIKQHNMKEKISDEKFEELVDKQVLEYIKDKNPNLWHQMAMEWNWDSSSVFLNWLVDNPKTDKATALMIYWKSAPRYWKKFLDRNDVISKKEYGLADFEFVEKVENNILNDFYQECNFEFDPKNDEQNYDWTNDYADEITVRNIPEILFEKIKGQKVEEPENFTEGMPPELYEMQDELYEKYDIE